MSRNDIEQEDVFIALRPGKEQQAAPIRRPIDAAARFWQVAFGHRAERQSIQVKDVDFVDLRGFGARHGEGQAFAIRRPDRPGDIPGSGVDLTGIGAILFDQPERGRFPIDAVGEGHLVAVG